MKHAYKPQPQAGADSAPGEVITLPPLQVRKTTPPLSAGCGMSPNVFCRRCSGWDCCCWAGSWRR
ncbi:nitrate ABC transporter [Klebsiella michiganensis]|uniref:Nitrate ABC transporter n=1 Tax=Klebsiella michiganensis TaxID=1134687 RepID=A0A7H4MX13_9ENTR|nr:nitrate ABC transporter [Klebsiella michiganensis]